MSIGKVVESKDSCHISFQKYAQTETLLILHRDILKLAACHFDKEYVYNRNIKRNLCKTLIIGEGLAKNVRTRGLGHYLFCFLS